MSIQAVAWVLEHSISEGNDRLVLLAIANHVADHHDGRGPVAWPSIATIASEARVDRATVHRAINRLVDLGELAVVSGGGRGHTNIYALNGRSVRPFSPEKPSQNSRKTVAPEPINGRTGATQNHKEPEPSRGPARAREATDTSPILGPVALPAPLPDDVRQRGSEFIRALRRGDPHS